MQISPLDNVKVHIKDGHKYALRDIRQGENVIKYGQPIGHATCDIQKGEHIHTHNLKTNLSGTVEYTYTRVEYPAPQITHKPTFMGYVHNNGSVGIRNDVWIVNTVGCVNKVAQKIAERTGAKYFPHPFGCSQLGDDQSVTQQILKGMVEHPNAGGVLVLGLGCENNNIEVFKGVLGTWDDDRVKFLNAQDVPNEIEEGVRLVRLLQENAGKAQRVPVGIEKLCIGLKCGGSDGLSGITANPVVGKFSDLLIRNGGSTVLTEVPEMFGAESILLNRCADQTVFDRAVDMLNRFKQYYIDHGEQIYENPSPGNRAGGITTLEDKSCGCIQKGGHGVVTDVIGYGEQVTKKGLTLLSGPGNDLVSATALTAAGAHLVLFTTGRGTPFGAPAPTMKIASNTTLAEKKSGWIDFNAGVIADGTRSIPEAAEDLLDLVLDTASGKQTCSERRGYREIAIFKDGVVL